MPLDPFIGTALLSAGGNLFSSVANGIFGSSVNEDNRSYYDDAQRRANAFARSERIATQEYNSPLNQLQLYSRAGMNPNLLTGQQFVPTTALNNQSVSPPQAENAWHFDNLGTSVINGLTQDLQIRKLQGDLKRQEIDNEDAQMQLNAKKMELMREGNFYDEFKYGTTENMLDQIVSYYKKPRNYYERKVLDERDDVFLARLQKVIDVDILRETAPALKKIPQKQFENFCQDLRGKLANNTLLEADASMMQKYGISSKDNDWVALIKIALRNPDAFSNILSALGKASSNTLNTIFDAVTPKSFKPKVTLPKGSW